MGPGPSTQCRDWEPQGQGPAGSPNYVTSPSSGLVFWGRPSCLGPGLVFTTVAVQRVCIHRDGSLAVLSRAVSTPPQPTFSRFGWKSVCTQTPPSTGALAYLSFSREWELSLSQHSP